MLLDYENVQPTESELRALVPDASQVWVFHGPHQRQVEERFASFGADATAVPISKTGKNALDWSARQACGEEGAGQEGGSEEGPGHRHARSRAAGDRTP